MTRRWAAAGMMEASKGFRRLKACKPARAGSSLTPPDIVANEVEANADAT